jgi:hypothetical protein
MKNLPGKVVEKIKTHILGATTLKIVVPFMR